MFFAVIVVLAVLAIYLVLMPAVCWVRARYTIPRRISRLGREPDFPVNVIVPCYGTSEYLEANLRAIASYDYPNAVTTFVTDTAEDASLPAIRAVLKENPRARHIVSGRSQTASGKNHAQLKAIQQDAVSEVFVIFDSDMRPGPGWLREMVRPFVDPGVSVTASSRYIVPHGKGVAPRLYTALETFRPLMLAAPLFVLVWGGYFAVRRKAFQELGLAELWQYTENDDLVMCGRMAKRGMKPVFVPAAMNPSLEVHETISSLANWFCRQAVTGKYHAFLPYTLLVGIETLVSLALAGSVALLAVQAATGTMDILSFTPLVVLILVIGNILMTKLPYRKYRDMSIWWWLFVPVPGHFIIAGALWQSAFKKRMKWAGATLVFNKDGTISRRIQE
jgi:ceramide glucosyltransferase